MMDSNVSELLCNSLIPLLATFPKELTAKTSGSLMFIATLLTKAERQMPYKCPPQMNEIQA
jgi:hypothetical protein